VCVWGSDSVHAEFWGRLHPNVESHSVLSPVQCLPCAQPTLAPTPAHTCTPRPHTHPPPPSQAYLVAANLVHNFVTAILADLDRPQQQFFERLLMLRTVVTHLGMWTLDIDLHLPKLWDITDPRVDPDGMVMRTALMTWMASLSNVEGVTEDEATLTVGDVGRRSGMPCPFPSCLCVKQPSVLSVFPPPSPLPPPPFP
jgi:hypothetical protein